MEEIVKVVCRTSAHYTESSILTAITPLTHAEERQVCPYQSDPCAATKATCHLAPQTI